MLWVKSTTLACRSSSQKMLLQLSSKNRIFFTDTTLIMLCGLGIVSLIHNSVQSMMSSLLPS